MHLPDIWGAGSIFAFSGLEGECTLGGGLVGTLASDRLGVILHTARRRELFFELEAVRGIEYELVSSDWIRGLLRGGGGREAVFHLTFRDQSSICGFAPRWAPPSVTCEGREVEVSVDRTEGDELVTMSDPGDHTVLCRREVGDGMRFVFVRDDDPRLARERALGHLRGDWDRLHADREAFYASLPRPRDASPGVEKTLYKCFSVLRSQVYSPEGIFGSRWTTPDRLPHRRLWLWDSVFHALGNRHISPELALETLRAVLDTQREDGFIPHMADPSGRSSDITQPPVLAWGFSCLHGFTGESDFLGEVFPALEGYLNWNIENRSTRRGLFSWKINASQRQNRCDESGMDNSPRFDEPREMECVDFSSFMANEARAMGAMARILGRPERVQYWENLYEDLRRGVNEHLWDDGDGMYYDRVTETGGLRRVRAVSSFLPLLAGICPPDRARRLCRHLRDPSAFNTPLPVPSIARDDPTFGTDMWRGPVWINYNYLILCGLKGYGFDELAAEIRRKTIAALAFWYEHDGTVYEFYDSRDRCSPSRLNRKGRCRQPYDFRVHVQSIRDYGWSCSLFVDLVLNEEWV